MKLFTLLCPFTYKKTSIIMGRNRFIFHRSHGHHQISKEITERMAKVYQKDAVKYSTSAKWDEEFKRMTKDPLKETTRRSYVVWIDLIGLNFRINFRILLMNDRRLKGRRLQKSEFHKGVFLAFFTTIFTSQRCLPDGYFEICKCKMRSSEGSSAPSFTEGILTTYLRVVTGDETCGHHWNFRAR